MRITTPPYLLLLATSTVSAFTVNKPPSFLVGIGNRCERSSVRAIAIDDVTQDGSGEEEEWEYEEYELLTRDDFIASEWKIGTLDKGSKKIVETWVRFLDRNNEAVWGDGSQGKWNVDVPNQFITISKESFGGWFGKKIWACELDDFYYMEGTVRGWSPVSAANVLAQWQARRLGVDREEAGVAPWFERSDEDNVAEDASGEQIEPFFDEAAANVAGEESSSLGM
mmetsp:Transcript_4920/g.7177  ORF Transcript_4920/g.7177 Transcript_4920/m.7177 type:complete len:225 (-) Transcript_4920:67-741(-)